MEEWKKEVNSKWFNEMKNVLKEGGVWMWPSTGYTYTLKGGKFVGESKEADEALKNILPKDDDLLKMSCKIKNI